MAALDEYDQEEYDRERDSRRRGAPYRKEHGFLYKATIGAVKKVTRPSWHRGMTKQEWRRRERLEA